MLKNSKSSLKLLAPSLQCVYYCLPPPPFPVSKILCPPLRRALNFLALQCHKSLTFPTMNESKLTSSNSMQSSLC